MSAEVKGYCPMGCGQTLFLGDGGYVTCSLDKCPNPSAACDILLDPETWHIVNLSAFDFSMQHPLRERLDGEFFDCPLNRELNALAGPPRQTGKYRVSDGPTRLWLRVGDSS